MLPRRRLVGLFAFSFTADILRLDLSESIHISLQICLNLSMNEGQINPAQRVIHIRSEQAPTETQKENMNDDAMHFNESDAPELQKIWSGSPRSHHTRW